MDISARLAYVKAMADQIKGYMLNDQLYGQLTGTAIEGTVGRTLLYLRQLYAADVTTDDLAEAKTAIENALDKWQVQATDKAQREAVVRLRDWEEYVDKVVKEPGYGLAADYPRLAETRTILHVLGDHMPDVLDEMQRNALASVDTTFRAVSQAGDFLWEADLKSGFPQADYWWLYVRPIEEAEE
ncbi:MAG: hypothetical protein GYB64_12180 [Chloroflexi bacterium]|nr:hypothetical protein [Chloroflexota bacterium]